VSPGPPPLKRESYYDERNSRLGTSYVGPQAAQSWDEAQVQFILGAGPISLGEVDVPFDMLDQAACDTILKEFLLEDGTLPDFSSGAETPTPVLEGPPTCSRGTQVECFPGREQGTQVGCSTARDQGTQSSLAQVSTA